MKQRFAAKTALNTAHFGLFPGFAAIWCKTFLQQRGCTMMEGLLGLYRSPQRLRCKNPGRV